jgi:hypothetical protein
MIVPDYVLADEAVGLAVAVERDYELLGLWRYPEPEYQDFKQCVLLAAEKDGNLPRFMIMSLGENHTTGTKPGTHTPDACVGSNDLALGKIVEAASASKFWNEMAIFVVEDDPQNGPDHVDCHRTLA